MFLVQTISNLTKIMFTSHLWVKGEWNTKAWNISTHLCNSLSQSLKSRIIIGFNNIVVSIKFLHSPISEYLTNSFPLPT
jgi:hypothetical protein